jgi:hypothetical protein
VKKTRCPLKFNIQNSEVNEDLYVNIWYHYITFGLSMHIAKLEEIRILSLKAGKGCQLHPFLTSSHRLFSD